jgi:predicted MPP superfamily phosphohydrolase
LRFIGWSVALLGVGLVIMLAAGLASTVADPVRREISLPLAGLAPGTPPYRIALLSDIHFGNRAMQRGRLERIVAAVNDAKPDLVVIVGDFVNGRAGKLESDPRELTGPLSGLRARDGVVATLGNHDHWTDPNAVRAALEAAGVKVLVNQAASRGPVMILGIDDGYSRYANIPAALATVPVQSHAPIVAITHSPDLSPLLPSRIGLLLAGHTHCGQVVLPGIGALAPVVGKLLGDVHYYDPHYLCGAVHDGRRTTIVTAGLGSGSIPFRIGAPPDWWLVTIVPAQPADQVSAPKGR